MTPNRVLRQKNMSTNDLKPIESIEPWHDEETLRYLYHEREMTQTEIAEMFEVTPGTISYWLDKHDIDARYAEWEGRTGRNNPNWVEYASYAVDGYAIWTSRNTDGNVDRVQVHQLLACVENDPYDVFSGDTHVHHVNTHPWDNRIENLEVLNNSDHRQKHCDIRKKASHLGDYEEAQKTKSMPAGLTNW
jgi:hypothetical protein